MIGATPGRETAVDALTVPMRPGAQDIFRALGSSITNELRQARGTAFTAILARVAENAQKLAMVRAVGIDPQAPEITAADAEWAIALVRHFANATMLAVERHVADNDIERNHKRILEIVRQEGRKGITKKNLYDVTRFLSRRDREDILATLVESERIVEEIRKTATKPVVIYRQVVS